MGTPHSRRGVLAALGALAAAGVVSGCTGPVAPVTPIRTTPTAPDPLLAVLDERVDLVERYDAAGRQHPELATRLLPLRIQTEEQVLVLRLALALPTAPPPTPTQSSSTGTAVPVDPAVSLSALRSAVRVAGMRAAALCETTSAERAPLVGSLAAAASCHELLLA